MIEKQDPSKICFVIQKYRYLKVWSDDKWHYVLRWIKHPYKVLLSELKKDRWNLTLCPGLESGLVTADLLLDLDKCENDDDLVPFIVKLNLVGISPMLEFIEEDNHLLAVRDINTNEMIIDYSQCDSEEKTNEDLCDNWN